MSDQPASTASLLFAGLIGLVAVGTFVATLTLVGRSSDKSQNRNRLAKDIDHHRKLLEQGQRVVGRTQQGTNIEVRKEADDKYITRVGGKKFSYPSSQDAITHFLFEEARASGSASR